MDIRTLIDRTDFAGIEAALIANPALANEGIPYDSKNTTKAHPLHRICDGVFAGTYTDDDAVKLAQLFLSHGSDVNGSQLVVGKDSPLVAASSLHADQVALLYINRGATINHPGTHGGTALHWAAWCGRPAVLEALVAAGSLVNQQCTEFEATPLFWAVRGYKFADAGQLPAYSRSILILLAHGADKSIPNKEGETISDMLTEREAALQELLR
jgi:ankyrin repeat protein